jgi:methionyl-tRNA synthetase
MRTNTKEIKDRIKNYLLENVTDGNENEFTSFEELAKYIKSELVRIYGNTHQSTFKSYMQGLPNAAATTMFYSHYYNYNVVLGGILGESETEYSKYTPEQAVELGAWLFYRELRKYF